MAFQLRSSAFRENELIPKKYTCDGSDVSVPLTWGDPPQGTKSFALIADDPDGPAGTWVHWVLYDLPPDTRELPESSSRQEHLENGAKQVRMISEKSAMEVHVRPLDRLIDTFSNSTH